MFNNTHTLYLCVFSSNIGCIFPKMRRSIFAERMVRNTIKLIDDTNLCPVVKQKRIQILPNNGTPKEKSDFFSLFVFCFFLRHAVAFTILMVMVFFPPSYSVIIFAFSINIFTVSCTQSVYSDYNFNVYKIYRLDIHTLGTKIQCHWLIVWYTMNVQYCCLCLIFIFCLLDLQSD